MQESSVARSLLSGNFHLAKSDTNTLMQSQDPAHDYLTITILTETITS